MTDSWPNHVLDVLSTYKTNPTLSLIVSEWTGHPFVIYGAGPAGKSVCDLLIRLGVRPDLILDAQADVLPDNYQGIPIQDLKRLKLVDTKKRAAVVLVCVIQSRDVHQIIKKDLVDNGFVTVLPWSQKAFSPDIINAPNAVDPGMYNFQDEILSCAKLFQDDLSRQFYLQLITACASKQFNDINFLDPEEQYFPSGISLKKGYQSFMDCGAFRGDTLDRLVERFGKPSTYVAFEPDSHNFSGLVENVNKLHIEKAILFPCAVSQHSGPMRFTVDQVHGGLGSLLDPDGEGFVQCVAIDDCMKGIEPTFIKFDIEGSEIDALLGAEETIRRHCPDLAVAVYHYADHYFRIPNLIHSWGLNYRFFLRVYDRFGTEAVLYATQA